MPGGRTAQKPLRLGRHHLVDPRVAAPTARVGEAPGDIEVSASTPHMPTVGQASRICST